MKERFQLSFCLVLCPTGRMLWGLGFEGWIRMNCCILLLCGKKGEKGGFKSVRGWHNALALTHHKKSPKYLLEVSTNFSFPCLQGSGHSTLTQFQQLLLCIPVAFLMGNNTKDLFLPCWTPLLLSSSCIQQTNQLWTNRFQAGLVLWAVHFSAITMENALLPILKVCWISAVPQWTQALRTCATKWNEIGT